MKESAYLCVVSYCDNDYGTGQLQIEYMARLANADVYHGILQSLNENLHHIYIAQNTVDTWSRTHTQIQPLLVKVQITISQATQFSLSETDV